MMVLQMVQLGINLQVKSEKKSKIILIYFDAYNFYQCIFNIVNVDLNTTLLFLIVCFRWNARF